MSAIRDLKIGIGPKKKYRIFDTLLTAKYEFI